jgi:hypothetical protein
LIEQKQKMRKKSRFIVGAIVALIAEIAVPLTASAAVAPFQQAYIRLDRMSTAQATGGTVCARQSAANVALTEANVVVTFPSTYTVNSTAANWTVATTDIPVGTFAWPGIGTATSATTPANVVTFPSGNLADSTKTYCFHFSGTNTLTTAAVTADCTVSAAFAKDTSDVIFHNGFELPTP